VRHATEADLDHLGKLLAELRLIPQLRERNRGSFTRGSRGFLHFHEHAGDFYVDVKLHSAYERIKVTSLDEQTDFLAQVKAAIQPDKCATIDGQEDVSSSRSLATVSTNASRR
jgi:hypothetical protein